MKSPCSEWLPVVTVVAFTGCAIGAAFGCGLAPFVVMGAAIAGANAVSVRLNE